MQEHLEQVEHNTELLNFLDEKSKSNYFDWKITITFYTAVHLIHALSRKKKRKIGREHKVINPNLDPSNSQAVMPLDYEAYQAYIDLYQSSRRARYTGVTCTKEVFLKLNEYEYRICRERLNCICGSLRKEGLPVK